MNTREMMELLWREGQCYSPLAVANWSEFRLKWESDHLQAVQRSSTFVLPAALAVPPSPASSDHQTMVPRAIYWEP